MLFSYFNPVLQMGLEKFADAAKAAGADGVLITDLTPEEGGEYRAAISLARPRHDFPGRANVHRRAPGPDRESVERVPVSDLAHGRDGRERPACRRIAGSRAARAARHRAAHRHRFRHFAAGARFGAWRTWPMPPWWVRRWSRRSSAPGALRKRPRHWRLRNIERRRSRRVSRRDTADNLKKGATRVRTPGKPRRSTFGMTVHTMMSHGSRVSHGARRESRGQRA